MLTREGSLPEIIAKSTERGSFREKFFPKKEGTDIEEVPNEALSFSDILDLPA